MVELGIYVVSCFYPGDLKLLANFINFEAPRQLVLNQIVATVTTSPSGGPLVITPEIYSLSGNTTAALSLGSGTSIQIADTQRTNEITGIGKILLVGDVLHLSITQVGGTIPGADLTIKAYFQRI